MAPEPAGAPPPAARQLNVIDGLAQLAFVVHGMLELRAAEHDLSITQARLLGVLRDRTPAMNELARLLGLDKSSISGLVDRAERRGLVARIPSAEDRRAVLVGLTDEGRSLMSRAAASFGADLTAMLDLLPPSDRDALSAIVSRLLVAHATRRGVDLFAGLETQVRPSTLQA
ncbi:MAG TPA: MarR family transcriptional regulator [Streptosporangiaceae bacterium]|jgi:DNA-binding MarR family transcriptional regulator|nr:MarR family transcriptional regulator [Streptosporangiaceae bacterium]